MYTPFSVQHPNNFTTFGCGSSPIYFMICSSWIRSRFSDSDALAFNIFTATVVGPEIKWTIEYSWVWYEENKIRNYEHFIYIKIENMFNLYCHQCCLSQTSILDRNLLLQANFDQQRFGAVCILGIPILSLLPESIDLFNTNKTGQSFVSKFLNIGIRESLDLLAYRFVGNGGCCSIGECWIIRVSANARACGYLSFTRATSVR